MHLIKVIYTVGFFFENAHIRLLNEAIFIFFFLNQVLTETKETTENSVVPMPGLGWCCMFTSVKVKEKDLVHGMFTIAVAHLANVSAAKKFKDGS